MKTRFGILFVLFVVFLSGCASHPQGPISLSRDAVVGQTGRIGVAMAPLPKVDMQVPGANCLLCLAVAYAANSSLTSYGQTLSNEDLANLKNEVATLLRKKGANVTVIDTALDVNALPDVAAKTPNTPRKDFSSLQRKYEIDKILIIDISELGFSRTYSSYIPSSDPKAMLRGAGYLVNLKNNTYEWYEPMFILKSADQVWDEPPKFPGLTNAYYQVLEMGKDRILQPLAAATADTNQNTVSAAPTVAPPNGKLP